MTDQNDERFHTLENQIQALMAQVAQLVHTMDESRNNGGSNSNGGAGHHRPRMDQHDYQTPTKLTKMEFPRFQRADVLGWILKRERYFQIDETPNAWKVKMASIHLDEKASKWDHPFKHTGIGQTTSWTNIQGTDGGSHAFTAIGKQGVLENTTMHLITLHVKWTKHKITWFNPILQVSGRTTLGLLDF